MNRLQKKCFLVSAATHGLLAAFLLFGLGFLKHPNPVDKLPILELVPDTLIDAALYGGGGPPAPAAASKPSPAAAASTTTAKPAPQAEAKPEPTPPKTVTKPAVREPVATKPPPKQSKPSKPDPEPDQDDTPPEKTTATKPSATSKIKVDTSKVATRTRPDKNTSKSKSKETSDAEDEAAEAAAASAAKAAADRRAAIGRGLANATQSLGSGLSTTTTIEMPGLGGGGPMYANWAQVVKSIYDHSWRQPEELADESATVEVDILVLKDGTVQTAGTRISRKSGIPSLDKSVQQVLDRVRTLPPFPEGATDAQRKLRIAFKLKQNRSAG